MNRKAPETRLFFVIASLPHIAAINILGKFSFFLNKRGKVSQLPILMRFEMHSISMISTALSQWTDKYLFPRGSVVLGGKDHLTGWCLDVC